MNLQTNTATLTQERSRWRHLTSWITAIEQAAAYDPQVQAAATIRQLGNAVEQLKTRVDALERHGRNGTETSTYNTVERC